jgi:bacteriorhodopsin
MIPLFTSSRLPSLPLNNLAFNMANDALNSNPQTDAAQHITVRGSDWLWAVFAIMFFSAIIVFVWQFFVPRGQRVFHHLGLVC